MSLNTEAEALGKMTMFRGVDPAKLKLLAFASERVEFAPGEAVCRQGDPPDAAFFILEGSVRVSRDAGSGPMPLGMLQAGTIVGDTCILGADQRMATVEAATPVSALRIEKAAFCDLLKEDAKLSFAVSCEFARRLDQLSLQAAQRLSGMTPAQGEPRNG